MRIFKRRKPSDYDADKVITENSDNYEDSSEPVLVTSIVNPVSSGIFQDILKENGIPFICRQNGAGGCVKLLFGGGVVPDEIYVAAKNAHKAYELYEAYLNTEAELEPEFDDGQQNSDSEDNYKE